VAAIGLGAQEVGADALAEAPVDWGRLQQRTDLLGPVQRASDEQLLRARTVLGGLRVFYGLYAMHALFMPDTPVLAALRTRIDEWGMFPVLDHVISLNPSPRHFAEGLATLLEQLAADPGLFQIPGDESGAANFMETWISVLREQTTRARERVAS
jgi:hypothetical protein